MDLAEIDLNLLRVFAQLMQDRRVSAAASALGLSQPATSNALARLRRLLGDQLFLRTPRGMEPTSYALELAGPVSLALSTLHDALNQRRTFEPASSERSFTLALSDVGEIYFLPELMHLLSEHAPGVTLRAVSVAGEALKEDMAGGRIDLALGLLPQLQAGFYQQVLFRQRYVCLMRSTHPLARKSRLSLKNFCAAQHVRVQATGTGHGRVDETLARLGIERRVRLTVPHFVALGHVLASSDLLAIVPERFALRVCKPLGLSTRVLPLSIDGSAIYQFWHARLHRDPANQWLRTLIASHFGASSPATKSNAKRRAE
jgi:DNA-binding transcriptional LysR family regulator